MALWIDHMTPQACYRKWFAMNNHFSILTMKIFPLKSFAIYGNYLLSFYPSGLERFSSYIYRVQLNMYTLDNFKSVSANK